MKKSFLKLESKTGEELVGNISSEAGLIELLDSLYNGLSNDMAIEVHIYRKYVLIGTRERGHGDRMIKKFTNFGFCLSPESGKSDALSFAIRTIDDGNLPDYCYRAINGDVEALRQTTIHLVRAYDAKVRRMQEKGKPAIEIEPFITRRDAASRRLELSDEELVEISEPIIIEVPKDPATFYGEYDVAIGNDDLEN